MYNEKEYKQRINDLEFSILSCILLKPELMEEVILEDKHFKRTQRMWRFMKAFYKKFKTFDPQIMFSICKERYQIVEWTRFLMEIEPTAGNFKLYQKQLLDLYNEAEKDKFIIDCIFEQANNLLVRNISTNDFKNKVDEIYKRANEIFKNDN